MFDRATFRYIRRKLVTSSSFIPTSKIVLFPFYDQNRRATYAADSFFRLMTGRVRVQVWITLAEPSFIQLWHGGEPL